MLASVSDNGVLAWASALAADRVAHWYNREGVVTGELEIESGRIGSGRLSPDDSRLAFQRVREGNGDIWLYDIETGTTRAVEAGSVYAQSPRWSADGRGVAYIEMSNRVMLADP